MKALDRFEKATKREWYERIAAVARLASVMVAEIRRAEQETLPDEEDAVWERASEADRVRAYTATEQIVLAASGDDSATLEQLATEHGGAFVMVARQVAGWLGMLDGAGSAS